MSTNRSLSVVIPSHNDIYLHKTIASLLDGSERKIEIIPVLDGYRPKTSITSDPRVRPVFHERNRGMRESINTGVAHATGTHLMRTDEHCMFGRGFDRIILETIEDNWIVVPRRYKLNVETWTRMDNRGFIDYEMLIIKQNEVLRKFTSVDWKQRKNERLGIPIDETMAMQGSCWIMSRKWWDAVVVRLDSNGYGPLYQDSTEMLFKTWRAGGKLMINKKTWYAHKHRSFNRTHHYPIERAIPEFAFAVDLWKDDYEKVRERWGV